jgi:hypothetical protein
VPSTSAGGVLFRTKSVPTAYASTAVVSAGCPVLLDVRRASSVLLPQGPGRATAYRISSPLSPSRALLALAPAFGLDASQVMWFRTGGHTKGWWTGSLAGPSLTTFSSKGITWWSYVGPRELGQHRGGRLATGAVTRRATLQLLGRVATSAQLGALVEARTLTSVRDFVPLRVHGVTTDEAFRISFASGGRIAAAVGPLATVTSAVTYPTISALDAARMLRRPMGKLVGLAAPTSTASRTSTRRPGPTVYCGDVMSLEHVSSASLTLRTAKLADGRVWLLPSWTFSGTRMVAWSAEAAFGAASAVAINPRFLDYQPAAIRTRAHRRAR